MALFNMFTSTFVFVMFYLLLNLDDIASCAPLPLSTSIPTAFTKSYSRETKNMEILTENSSQVGSRTELNDLSTSLNKWSKRTNHASNVGTFSIAPGEGSKHTDRSSEREDTAKKSSGVTPRKEMKENNEKEQKEESGCGGSGGEGCKKQSTNVNGRKGEDTNMIVIGIVGSVLGLLLSVVMIWCLVWRGAKREDSKGTLQKKIMESDMEEGRMNMEEKSAKKVSWDPNIADKSTMTTSIVDSNSAYTKSTDKESMKKKSVDKKNAKKNIDTKAKTGKNLNDTNLSENVDEYDDNYIPWGHPPEILSEFDEGESRWCHILGF